MLDRFFERIFVINLDGRTDKWDAIQEKFREADITNYERFSAIKPDLSALSPEFYKEMSSKEKGRDERYLIGACGCKLSHIGVIELARQRGYRNALIFEDDVFFLENAADLIDKALTSLGERPWDMFYLGGRHRSKRKARLMDDHLIRILCTYQTHAYAISRQAYDPVLEILKKSTREVDRVYAEEVHPTMTCYGVHPSVALQDESVADIGGGLAPIKDVNTGNSRAVAGRLSLALRRAIRRVIGH